MPLCIYVGKNNLPKNKKFIFDVEAEFFRYGIKDCRLSKEIIKEIDNGKYINESTFLDRFGVSLYTDYLSTSSKALLLLISCKDKVLNFDEVGDNAIKYALTHFNSGNIFISDYYGDIDEDGCVDLVMNDEIHYTDAYIFNEDWGE